VTATEAHILRAQRAELVNVFQQVFTPEMVEKAAKREAKADHDVLGARYVAELDDSIETHKAKIGRWTVETLKSIGENFFWASLMLGSITRQPLVHLQNWLQRPTKTTEAPKVITFVCLKAVSIGEEYDIMFDDAQFQTIWDPLLEMLEDMTAEDEAEWLAKSAQVID
jgi:hypothetical protein